MAFDVEAQAASPVKMEAQGPPSTKSKNSHSLQEKSPIAEDPCNVRRLSRNKSNSQDTTGANSTVEPVGSHQSSTASSTSQEDIEERNLFLFAEALRKEDSHPEPWFLEMTRLRRLHFMYLNKQLAACRKQILEKERVSDEDMTHLASLLRQQADAIRDFQYIRALDFLPPEEQNKRENQCMQYFPNTAHSHFDDILPFRTENYRCLPRESGNEPLSDGIREFLRTYLPVRLSWPRREKKAKPDLYLKKYKPKTLSRVADRFARFLVAFAGALFILVPMYIMAVHESKEKNLITTTVAVLLFAMLCSLTLKASNDQTLAATVGYAAVLMVFVGLTSQN